MPPETSSKVPSGSAGYDEDVQPVTVRATAVATNPLVTAAFLEIPMGPPSLGVTVRRISPGG
ncbi:hypothetical protein ACFFX0_02600 [Citricoccus parietis]|uniref:Uncharacterized protein n=1 Tax=Citricoccus parietis TaxID=592307 RepID=A0ABV5FU02_9MICC